MPLWDGGNRMNKTILALHFSLTPLAGSPIRIVKTLNEHTKVKARLVVLNPKAYGERVFENDLIWDADKDKLMDLLEKADIIHLHHFFDLEHNQFGINFLHYLKKGKKIIRQFHSTPMHISKSLYGKEDFTKEIVYSDIPQLVIPHYPERFFPFARVVPNIVPIRDELYQKLDNKESKFIKIFYAPSLATGAWEERWDTKGAPETKELLNKISSYYQNVQIKFVYNLSHEKCLKERQKSHISIDEMVTGSFHLSSLESLSQGIPTFAFLDQRTLWNIEQLTGTIENPWLNFRLEEAEQALHELINDSDLRKEIGDYSREWMGKYWDDKKMILHYVNAYNDLLENPDLFLKPRFDLNNKRVMWFVREYDDVIWQARSGKSNKNENNKQYDRGDYLVKDYDSKVSIEDLKKEAEIGERMKKYYQMLNKWLRIQQRNHNLSELLIRKDLYNIVIYGLGEIGKNLLEELKDTPINIGCVLVKEINPEVCMVKQVVVDDYSEFQKNNKIDTIIVTPVYDFENIRDMLIKKGVTSKVVSLDELIDQFFDELYEVGSLSLKVKKLEKQMTELAEKLKIIEEMHPQTLWLYKNKVERMDANVELFNPERRIFHKARYNFALDYVKGKDVADIACGTGYGTEMLKVYGSAKTVIGIDVDQEAIKYAILNHKPPFVGYICTSGEETGLDDESVDVVVSFETLEHVPDDYALLREFYRILKRNGLLICSVPNNWEISRLHLRSYDRKKLEKLLGSFFSDMVFYNQNSGQKSALHNHGQPAGICLTTDENENLAECYIVVCRKDNIFLR